MTKAITRARYEAAMDRASDFYDAQRGALYAAACAAGGVKTGGAYTETFSVTERAIWARACDTFRRLRNVAARHGIIEWDHEYPDAMILLNKYGIRATAQ